MSALTKSYVNTYDAGNPVIEDAVMGRFFKSALAEGHVGELILLETKERISTTDILAKADRYAKSLIALCMIPGEDHLAVVGGNSVEIVSLFAATTLIGVGFAHPFIYKPMEKRLTDVLPLVKPKVVVAGEGHGGDIFPTFSNLFDPVKDTPASDQLPFVQHIFYDKTCAANSRQTINCIKSLDDLLDFGTKVSDEKLREYKLNVKPDYIMHHLFTSGSTGKPKCVAHTQGGMTNEFLQRRASMNSVMTMHINGHELMSYSSICQLLCGQISKLVLIPDLKDNFNGKAAVYECTEAIVSENVEQLVLPGALVSLIAGYYINAGIPTPNLKSIFHGSQLVTRSFKERNEKIFGGIAYTRYGCSEVFSIASTPMGNSTEDHNKRMEAQLFAKPNTELRLVDENNEVVDVGTEGEIQVKTYSRFKEYRCQEDKTRELFTDDGFLKTGDIGVMFPDGSFIIKGRATDAIRLKIHEFAVYPGPLEQVVSTHPSIKEISVVSGRTNDWMGDELTYCIQLIDGVTEIPEQEILDLCGNDVLKRPARIIYLKTLPLTSNYSKVSKKRLREQVEEMLREDDSIGKTNWFKDMESQMQS